MVHFWQIRKKLPILFHSLSKSIHRRKFTISDRFGWQRIQQMWGQKMSVLKQTGRLMMSDLQALHHRLPHRGAHSRLWLYQVAPLVPLGSPVIWWGNRAVSVLPPCHVCFSLNGIFPSVTEQISTQTELYTSCSWVMWCNQKCLFPTFIPGCFCSQRIFLKRPLIKR